MGVHKKLGDEICPKCGNLGRIKFVNTWNTKVRYSTKNRYSYFIHNDRSIKKCYIGSYEKYQTKQIKEHPNKEILEWLYELAKKIKYIEFLICKFAEKYVRPLHLTKEEDERLAVGIRHQRESFSRLEQFIKFIVDGILLRMVGAQIPKERLEEEKRLKLILKEVERDIANLDKLMVENPRQIFIEAKNTLISNPFNSALEEIMKKNKEYEKRKAKAKHLKLKLSESHFGSEKYPNYDLLTG